jgi:hypothetical protein
MSEAVPFEEPNREPIQRSYASALADLLRETDFMSGVSGERELLHKAADEIDALESQRPGWRTIDTAPQDGTWFLASMPCSTVPVIVRPIGPDAREYETFWNEGWDGEDIPIHWMPLPEPPISQSGVMK